MHTIARVGILGKRFLLTKRCSRMGRWMSRNEITSRALSPDGLLPALKLLHTRRGDFYDRAVNRDELESCQVS